jgi:hypothetical protein
VNGWQGEYCDSAVSRLRSGDEILDLVAREIGRAKWYV